MSFETVMNGPMASAGSMPTRESTSGTVAPTSVESTITMSRARPAVSASCDVSLPKPDSITMPASATASTAPLSSATASSLPMRRARSPRHRSPEASPCTAIADDWMPAFPAIAITMGMNSARTGATWSASSKPTITSPDT